MRARRQALLQFVQQPFAMLLGDHARPLGKRLGRFAVFPVEFHASLYPIKHLATCAHVPPEARRCAHLGSIEYARILTIISGAPPWEERHPIGGGAKGSGLPPPPGPGALHGSAATPAGSL